MNFHILTLFPQMVMDGLSASIIGRAMEQNKIAIEAINIRDFSKDKHRKVDDYTYGGGAGMLMQAQPVFAAWASVKATKPRTIYVTPQGRPFTQKMAEDFAMEDDLVILCGHYEGIDERVLEEVVTDYVSIGDYVLTGGELAAMVIVDAVSRLVPGVLNNEVSAETESFHGDLLEYPQYSRPKIWHGKEVPQILLSGNEKEIQGWRLKAAEARTKERRPDLFERYQRLQKCKELLLQQKLLNIDMIALIHRGRAELIYEEKGEIVLKDQMSGQIFHSLAKNDALTEEELPESRFLKTDFRKWMSETRKIILHQQQMEELFAKETLFHTSRQCYHLVYTRHEKLPITGLYRMDGKETKQGLLIRKLALDECDVAKQNAAREVFGAYLDEKQAGWIALMADGSIGQLHVKPEYRRRKIGTALVTFAINDCLEKGKIPYAVVDSSDELSIELMKQRNMYVSKTKIYFLEK